MEKIVDIIESIAHEKGLDIDEVKKTVTLALVKTAKKIYGQQYEYGAEIDAATKILEAIPQKAPKADKVPKKSQTKFQSERLEKKQRFSFVT